MLPIIKLDAIDSTNDYLKQLAREKEVTNFTIVTAREQTKGRGQMGAKWVSEPGKNLTMSILFKEVRLEGEHLFDFNVAVTLGVMKVLFSLNIPELKIKWPNDIMAGGKKLGGILIENTFKSDGSFTAVVGLGLNLNQTDFEWLPQATSLTRITGLDYNPEDMALLFGKGIQTTVADLEQNAQLLWENYRKMLFKLDYPCAFEDSKGNRFMGIIKGVTHEGRLAVMLEDDSVVRYDIKEIKMLF
ncbi:biotin--[acetyl-CoA-carboxylase] ligase [Flavobacterium silvisoli]|uniref:Biotin--[acetyl-CoA-carboxylase] ligase n=1 Tax=Flavobacterium silvisoli TaxID=2529433 RepID=A0A4Q9Z4N0_9FLAO|nr:biotin--[acetyl-CoA-carboxylase] ligase [Flavobacterium silvisoli]TBX70336.1 biotin--[acetyl-CoA-carboxylase] ligase [Flavobacterium silvisoli]